VGDLLSAVNEINRRKYHLSAGLVRRMTVKGITYFSQSVFYMHHDGPLRTLQTSTVIL
jgi:hypothetical protein